MRCSVPHITPRYLRTDDHHQAEFGAPGSPVFEAARRNFIVSEAGYAIASFLLQVRRGGQCLCVCECVCVCVCVIVI